MHIGVCIIELHLPGNGSLKGKRSVIKSIVTRVSREFNVSRYGVNAESNDVSLGFNIYRRIR